jgi:hypothetical protein
MVLSGVDDMLVVQGMGKREEMEKLLEWWKEWIGLIGFKGEESKWSKEEGRWVGSSGDWCRLVEYVEGSDGDVKKRVEDIKMLERMMK